MFFEMMKWSALRLFCGPSWMATPPALVELASCLATPPALIELAVAYPHGSNGPVCNFWKERGGSNLFILNLHAK